MWRIPFLDVPGGLGGGGDFENLKEIEKLIRLEGDFANLQKECDNLENRKKCG